MGHDNDESRTCTPATPAPWAEVVPGMGPVTVADLLTIPDDGYVYEVVEGVLVRLAVAGSRRRPLPTISVSPSLPLVSPAAWVS